MSNKIIGLIISAMDSESSIELYKGIRDEAQKNGYTTEGFVIYPSTASSKVYNEGEYSIYDYVDFSKFDAVIASLNTIADVKVRKQLADKIVASNIPVVSIDYDLANSYMIRNDNYDSVKAMLHYLVEYYGKTKINYISGPMENKESQQRYMAYMDGMAECGLSTEQRVFEGSFFVQDGQNALRFFESNPVSWDFDAIMCGNDMAAISVFAELKKRNISVPEDVIITGYDNVNEVMFSPILSIGRDNYGTGVKAIEILRKHWAGEEVPKVTYAHAYFDKAKKNNGKFFEERVNNLFETSLAEKMVHANIRSFVEESSQCNSFEEYLTVIKKFVRKINPKCFCLSIMKEYCELFNIETNQQDILEKVIVYENGNFLDKAMINEDRSDSIRGQELNSPIHFLENKFGYISFSDSYFPLMPLMYWDWIMGLNHTMNNVYRDLLKREMYMKDGLTGVYNRSGYDHYSEVLVQKSLREQRDICVVFVDLNGLKTINDHYGHESGDVAICALASILKKYNSPSVKVFRYGGDEFVVLAMGYSLDQVMKVGEKLKKDLQLYRQENNIRFNLSASVGYCVRSYDSDEDIETYVKNADERMYEQKRAQKLK